MILKSNKEEKIRKKFDICIVGSGIAASSLTVELLNSNLSFIIVEAGDLDTNSTSLIQKEITGRDFGLVDTHSIEVGGSSSLWHGVLAPLDKIDFEKRSWVKNSGWPIKYNDLERYYKKAGKIFKIDNFNFFDKEKLPIKIISNMLSLRFNKNILQYKIFQRPIPILKFKNILLKKLKNSESCHLLYNTAALELIHNNSKKVKKLICGNKLGEKFNIEADTFVICAGALETPRLLLNSKVKNKNIGKYLMDHPMGATHQIKFKHKQNMNFFNYFIYSKNLMIKAGLTFTESSQKNNKLPNHCFYTKAAYSKGIDLNYERVFLSLKAILKGDISIRFLKNILFNLNSVFSIFAIKFKFKTKYTDIFFVTEQIPDPESRITLSNITDNFGYPIAKINWKLSIDDYDSVDNALNLLKTRVFDTNYAHHISRASHINWKNSLTSAAHHLGTARMSETENNGVVDKNLKVFNIKNLYICDGSVFPTAGNANSGFTISALSCRLADHLKSHK